MTSVEQKHLSSELVDEGIRVGLFWTSPEIHKHILAGCGEIDDEQVSRLESHDDLSIFLEERGSLAVIVEITKPSQNSLAIVEEIRTQASSCAVILAVEQRDEKFRKDALRAGAQDVIVVDETPPAIVGKIVILSVERERSNLQRRNIERELEKSIYFTNKLLNEIGSALIRVSTEGLVIWWNDTAEYLTGIPAHAASGHFIQELDAPFVVEAFGFTENAVPTDSQIDAGEFEITNPDGVVRQVRVELVPLVDKGVHFGWLIHAIDITDLRAGRKRLEDSNEIFRQLTENIDDIFWVYDLDFSCWLYVSPTYERIWGRPLSDLEAAPGDWSRLIPAEQRAEIMTQIVFGGGKAACECSYTIERSDGSVRQIRDRVFPIRAAGERVRRIARITSDVTDELEVKEQLHRAQKLEAIGQLAAGIAHEINTPTQYVSDNVRFLQDSFEELIGLFAELRNLENSVPEAAAGIRSSLERVDAEYLEDEIPKALNQTIDGLQRISKIVGAMKDFSHPGVEGFQITDLNAALETTATISRNEWKYTANLTFDLDPELPAISCLPSEVNQVFLNMIVNAAHAIVERRDRNESPDWMGSIHIKTRSEEDFVVVEITDSGCGIPEQHKNRIFDLFFTTKPLGKGTGQGLALCHSVITKKHGGTIDLESTLGEGTTFFITLPIQQATEPA